MRGLLLFLLPSFVVGCGSSWSVRDEDGDGKSILDGDCWDAPEGGTEVGPNAAEIWYDGVDQDCNGGSDFDKDGDGVEAAGFGEGTDCWDDPDVVPEAFEAINGFPALTAADVYPSAPETYYDGVDANCDGLSDFDQDLDGFETSNEDYRQADGSSGDDCYDSADADAYPESGLVVTTFDPAEVNPAAVDVWYDGTDADCDGASDYDQDADGYNVDAECDDLNAAIFPDPDVEEVWYNEVDENCDGNLYDKDEDGFASAAYGGDDCWDDYATIPEDFVAINGRAQPTAAQVFPGAVDAWYDAVDGDCAGDSDFDQDLDGFDTSELPGRAGATGTDCEDEDAEAYPGASEIYYNGVDNDCDGGSDYDADGDGFDHDEYISTGTDCNDGRAEVNPAANEACGTTYDDNCDGELDLLDATDCITYYYDGDSDTYGTTTTECWCEAQTASGFDALNDDDCDDASDADYPGATETVANSDDEDCDGVDSCYTDDDGDNYGTTVVVDGSSLNCTTGTGAPVSTDCDDASVGDYPGAPEIVANSDDEDCDGVDSCYTDADNDNYGTTVVVDGSSMSCTTGTGAPVSTDCDDASSSDYPGATEAVANGDDEDCDGVDSCYTDADGDNYGTTVVVDGSSLDCATGTGAALSTDCDDASATDYPGATEVVANSDDEDCDGVDSCYTDADNDNYGTTVVTDGSSLNCTTGTGAPNDDDCNDGSSSIRPGGTETVADGIDQDCDSVDSCYTDADNDNYGTTVVVDGSTLSCSSGTGAANDDDCDDGSATINPAGTETVADGIDQDCDSVDSCYTDADNDNYGTTVVTDGSSLSCTTGTGAPNDDDCNDSSSSIRPGGTETVADGVDQDCDSVDSCYTDADGDNYGTTVVTDGSSLSCSTGTGAANDDDCNDGSATIYPGASETTADGIDQDCDLVDSCYTDSDGDNYGTIVVTDGSTLSCSTGTGAPNDDDCDDASSSIHPGATEACNDLDEDCDGTADDGLAVLYTDADGDLYGTGTGDCSIVGGASNDDDCDDTDEYVKPGAVELCDEQQNNCSTSWTSASEDGKISLVTTAGAWSDVPVTGSIALEATGTYYVCRGTFNTKLVASGDSVSVIGYYGAAETILDNTSTGSTVSVTNGRVILDGLTIAGGPGSSGYGGGVLSNGTTTLSQANVTLQDCIVEDNAASYGAGVAVIGSGWMELIGTTIQDNVATDGGGAWVATAGLLEVTAGSVITSNDAALGAGIFVQTAGEVTIDASSVHTNVATDAGGGIYLDDGSLALTGADVYANTAATGAGLWIDVGTATCDSTSGIFANIASGHGGGVYIADDDGIVVFGATDCDFTGTGDNSPNDVEIYDGNGSAESDYVAYATYGATATFACTLGICTPSTDP